MTGVLSLRWIAHGVTCAIGLCDGLHQAWKLAHHSGGSLMGGVLDSRSSAADIAVGELDRRSTSVNTIDSAALSMGCASSLQLGARLE